MCQTSLTAVQKATLKRDFPYSVFAALLLMILGGVGMKQGRFDSAVFLVFFAIFIGTMIRMALKAGKEGDICKAKKRKRQRHRK